MKNILFPARNINRRLRRAGHQLKMVALGLIALLALAGTLRAGKMYVPNGSFESPSTADLSILIDSWQDNSPSPYFNPTNFNGYPWQTLMGRFANTPQGNFDHLDNLDGSQAAYIFTFPGAGFFQDYNSVDWAGAGAHVFNSMFEPGRSYHLTTAFTSSSNQPLTNGASLMTALYYRDATNGMAIVAQTNIVFNNQVFTNLDHFLDVTIDVPTVNATNAWAGKNIGIEFSSTTYDSNLITGVWDLDNVRLTSTIAVPNGSFESPPTADLSILIDSWQDNPPSPYFNPTNFNGYPWQTLMGRFANTPPQSFDHIDNMDGTQASYIFTFPGAGFFQDFSSVDWAGAGLHNFNVTLDPGKSYTVTAGVTSSSNQPLTNGASIQLALYYRDAQSNQVVLASTNIIFNTSVFTNLDHLLDFQATIPWVKPTDPWAGRTLGIGFQSTTYDFNLVTGVWDLDNVRLTEQVATALVNPTATNGQVNLTVQSEPGLAFDILSTTSLAVPSWSTLATITNVSGNYGFSGSATNQSRFYKAHQLP